MIIRCQNDVIAYVEDNCRVASVRNHVLNGKYEYLGGFSEIPPTTCAGWMLCIHPRVYDYKYIAVIMHEHGYGIYRVDRPHWEYWNGDKGGSYLQVGDNPELYLELKNGEEKRSSEAGGCAESSDGANRTYTDPSNSIQLGKEGEN